MANMSTVASLVSYRPYKIIDTTVNMFINVGTQKHATGRFDQFEGISRWRAQTWCKSVLRSVAASPDVTPS